MKYILIWQETHFGEVEAGTYEQAVAAWHAQDRVQTAPPPQLISVTEAEDAVD